MKRVDARAVAEKESKEKEKKKYRGEESGEQEERKEESNKRLGVIEDRKNREQSLTFIRTKLIRNPLVGPKDRPLITIDLKRMYPRILADEDQLISLARYL